MPRAERRRRALRASETLFPYFAIEGALRQPHARATLSPQDIGPPPLSWYFNRLMDFAQGADWGRTPPSRHEAATVVDPRTPVRLRVVPEGGRG